MQTDNQNLVSIVVVSYNSATYIVETLNSIFNQSYSPLELIISDDGSTDDTTTICKEWIFSHKSRFTDTLLIESAQNTGISANLNRGEAKASGRWVKPFAADDILLPDAIGKYVNYMSSHPEVIFLFGKIQPFGDSEMIPSFIKWVNYYLFHLPSSEQYATLMTQSCFIPAPAFFFDRKKSNEMGIHNDEDIPMIEDWPKWINITKNGVKLFLMDEIMVNYRIHSNSFSSANVHKTQANITSQCQVWLKYIYKYQLRLHPRLTIIKYIKMKQYITHKKIWFFLESLGRAIDPLYRKLKRSTHCDWDDHDVC